jgi:hypothetical protein
MLIWAEDMSCIATLYVLPEGQHAGFMSSKEREPRVEQKKVLFFTLRKQVAGEQVWEFLDRVATNKTDLDFSGFLLVDYLFVYLQIAGDGYFERLDEYYSALSPGGAEKLGAFLATRPVDRAAIEHYLKEDGRPLAESERDDTLAAYEKAHSSLLEWCATIRAGVFGVLHLSF